MELIVDLHVHSHYSRATSKDCNLEGLYRWGKLKGINIIGTGDFTHPDWFAEFRSKLQPAERNIQTLNKFCKVYINGFDGAKDLREKLMAARSTTELLNLLV